MLLLMVILTPIADKRIFRLAVLLTLLTVDVVALTQSDEFGVSNRRLKYPIEFEVSFCVKDYSSHSFCVQIFGRCHGSVSFCLQKSYQTLTEIVPANDSYGINMFLSIFQKLSQQKAVFANLSLLCKFHLIDVSYSCF